MLASYFLEPQISILSTRCQMYDNVFDINSYRLVTRIIYCLIIKHIKYLCYVLYPILEWAKIKNAYEIWSQRINFYK